MKVEFCFKHLKKVYFINYVPNICENYSDLHLLHIFTDLNFNCNYGIRTCVDSSGHVGSSSKVPELYMGDAGTEVCPRH
jgi:hypothetical protein